MARTTARAVAAKPAATKSTRAAAKPAAKAATKAAAKAAAKPAAKPAGTARAKAVASPARTAKQAAAKIAKPGRAARGQAGAATRADAGPQRPVLVRDSFTMPEQEYAVLGTVKQACLKAGFEVKKSELLRIGVALLGQLDIAALRAVLGSLPQLKTGRPPGE